MYYVEVCIKLNLQYINFNIEILGTTIWIKLVSYMDINIRIFMSQGKRYNTFQISS